MARQALDYSQRDGRCVHTEVAAERGTGIGEAEAISAQRGPVPRDKRRDLVGDRPHPVRNRDHRPALSGEAGGDVRGSLRFIGVPVVPFVVVGAVG